MPETGDGNGVAVIPGEADSPVGASGEAPEGEGTVSGGKFGMVTGAAHSMNRVGKYLWLT